MNKASSLLRSFVLAPLALLPACGASSSAAPSHDGGAPANDASAPAVDGAQGGDASESIDAGASAVASAIAGDPHCKTIPDFYWEIGDVSGVLASGAVGTLFSATTPMNIASASKLVFGAYVVERFKADLSQMDASAMRMLAGYTSLVYDTCVGASTVAACFAAANNSTQTAADVGRFYYNGGNFQSYAIALGLGGDDDAALTTEIKSLVGPELSFNYSSPQLAAGIKTTAADYAAFLRKILAGKLALASHLGEAAVCTLPSSCPTAVYSPAPAAWHYSYAHWVEDDPSTGDGAFSSPGAFGFYPWIDATKTYYGILARYSLGAQAYLESAECGAAIRKAFVTGRAP